MYVYNFYKDILADVDVISENLISQQRGIY